MHQFDVHVVSLKSEWDHICVPSKAVSAISEGSAILFNCSEKNDNWRLLQKAGWRMNDQKKLNTEIKDFLNKINNEDISSKKMNAREISLNLQELKS